MILFFQRSAQFNETYQRSEDSEHFLDCQSIGKHWLLIVINSYKLISLQCEQPEKKRKIKANLVIMDAIKRIT